MVTLEFVKYIWNYCLIGPTQQPWKRVEWGTKREHQRKIENRLELLFLEHLLHALSFTYTVSRKTAL